MDKELRLKLDKIIELLEFMKDHHHIQLYPAEFVLQPKNYKPVDMYGFEQKDCNCNHHQTRELTGG